MNYEFHVGDYVETNDGAIGYVSDVRNMWWRCVLPADGYYSNSNYSIIGLDNNSVPKYFVRIGAYDFTKKEKKKIGPISDCNKHIFANAVKPDNQLVRTVSDDILNKINELVDAVNKLMDDYDEHIETHRQADR